MKTRDKILQTSLMLFNQEGESHVTTVDIANEMDISPGNLYYHFKGKEIIIETLYSRFDEAFGEILQAPVRKELSAEDSWYYLYVVFEEMYEYRFIYLNLDDLLQRYDSIQKRFKRLFNLKFQTATALVKNLRAQGVLMMDDYDADVLANNIVMTVTYWISFSRLKEGVQNEQQLLHKGVFQVLSLIAPYMSAGRAEYRAFCEAFYSKAMHGELSPPAGAGS